MPIVTVQLARRDTPTTRAIVSTSCPWRMGRLKSTCSERAVTTVLRA